MIKSQNEFNLYMLLLLLKQSYEWGHTIDKSTIHFRFKKDINDFLNVGNRLFKTIEQEFKQQGDDVNDLYWEQSEIISQFFEFLKKADIEKKNELIDILNSYMKGDLKINYGENDCKV